MSSLREKLRIKQDVGNTQKSHNIIIPIPTKPETIHINKITIENKQGNFDISELMKRLDENKLKMVVAKPTIQSKEAEPVQLINKRKIKKLTSKMLTGLQEEGISIAPTETQEQQEGVKEGAHEQKEKAKEGEEGVEEVEEIIMIKPKRAPRGRKTKAPPKGIAILSPEEWVEIGDTTNVERLPEKQLKVNYKVSSYYMNNREIFINAMNSLFEPYREKILDDTSQITCDNIGNDAQQFSLLIHQMVVRDYLNLYTPYRGLLLYHGLGSGKCHAKGTPIIMSTGEIKLVENIVVGDTLMGDDSTPRQVLSLAQGTDRMYNIISNCGDKYKVNKEHILCLKASGFPKLRLNKHTSVSNYMVQWIEDNNFQVNTFTFNTTDDLDKNTKKAEAIAFFETIQKNDDTNKNIIEVSVKEYLLLTDKQKNALKGYKVPVTFSEKTLPLDPYTIGCWLSGKTHKYEALLTEIHTKIANLNEESKAIFVKGTIPFIYKCNSRTNRLLLLAGFIDICGHLCKNGDFVFTQNKKTLMNDIVFLVRSLGFGCYTRIKKSKKAWSIRITGSGLELIPTLIPRKQATPKSHIVDALVTKIRVEYAEEGEYYGFMLDGNCRYLIGDFSVTHNTCTSIALAEGMKNNKKVIVMTPASLRPNYIAELKKCGDALYKTNQYWEWIDTTKHPEAINTLSSMLNLSVSYIDKQGGAWLVNVSKNAPYPELSPVDKKKLDDQINEMIETKYSFINYNGLRRDKWRDMTNNFEKNLFDDAVVIIDEAHNLISRIVNKIGKEKEAPVNKKTGDIERRPFSLALNLYQDLMSAKNARIVLLTGTPIINYPNEVGILFNILRGYIKTWHFSLDIKTRLPVNKESLHQMFIREKLVDYLDYSDKPSPKLSITRNPFGFENKEKTDEYHGVTNKSYTRRDESGTKRVVDPGTLSDEEFQQNIIRILKKNEIDVLSQPTIDNYKALPDKFDDFVNLFIDSSTGKITNVDMLKKRIMGLTSYFRSAQEKLLPRYDKVTDYHVIRIPMSDYQFTIYEEARKQERNMEKQSKKKKGGVDENGIYKEPTSTYRIFSRLFCNFVMPKPPGRPLPIEEKETAEMTNTQLENVYEGAMKLNEKITEDANEDDEKDTNELEGDQIIDNMGDATYEKRMRNAIQYVKEHAADYLSPEGLETYSPKYLHMLENIQSADHIGVHLVYSQFRTLEGIGMFKMVLEENGYTQFKIKKDVAGEWALDISEENRGKPTFALYTGTETKDEKETILNIFNGEWNKLTPSFAAELNSIAHNNNVGEIIKVLMITASGSEGINLRNTRYVHIMEPYWHPARMEQVIGRARRICSHKNLPEELQTVEVFVYLMTFSLEQVKSDVSIELKQKDLSKKKYQITPDKEKMDYIPFTSDQALFEISLIKEEVSTKITNAIKEASIDCSLYSRAGAKEQLHCLQFGNPSPDKFAYDPNYKKDKPDTSAAMNKEKITWRGVETTLRGKTYISRKIPEKGMTYLYDFDSYKRALENPGIEPSLVYIVEKNERGENVVKKV